MSYQAVFERYEIYDDKETTAGLVSDFMICILSSLVIGLIIAVMYMYQNGFTRSFIVTLVVPGDLDYTEIFDDIFEKYTKNRELVSEKR